jgi:hypothetical protein
MTLAQGLTAIIVFWAVVGGIGASLLLPAMQSLIHGNFEGRPRQGYAWSAAAAIAARSARCSGGSSPPTCRGGGFLLEVVSSRRAVRHRLVRDVPYTGHRPSTWSARLLSVCWHGRHRAGILVWQEGGESSARCCRSGDRHGGLAWWLRGASAREADALDAGPVPLQAFRFVISQQTLQQIALGGAMIALPIYLQMVLEYKRPAGRPVPRPALAEHVRRGAAGREEGGNAAPEQHHPVGFALLTVGCCC